MEGQELQPYEPEEQAALTVLDSPEMEDSIAAARNILLKQYLSDLHDYEIVPAAETFLPKDLNGEASDFSRFFCIKSITYSKEEDNLQKLSNVYNALSVSRGSLVLLIDGDGEQVRLYIGVKTFEKDDLVIAQTTLEKTLEGNFPGCRIERLKNRKIDRLVENAFCCTDEMVADTHRVISSVSGIASTKKTAAGAKKQDFTQGIEKLIDSMRGEKYTALIIADPILPEQAMAIKDSYEEMYSLLKPYEGQDLSFGSNESRSVTDTLGKSTSVALSHSVSNSTSVTHSSSTSYSTRRHADGKKHKKVTVTNSTSRTASESVTDGTTNTESENTSTATGTTEGTSRSLQIKTCNRKVKTLLDKIDMQLKRFDENGDIGLWNCAAYFIADSLQTSNAAAMAYYALTKGETTGLEHTAINTWSYDSDDPAEQGDNLAYLRFEQYLRLLSHPLFRTGDAEGTLISTSSVLTTNELTVHAGIPQKSVPGLAVSEFASFGRNVFSYENGYAKAETTPGKLRIGQITHMGKTEGTEVSLDVGSLCSHVFITGSTGAGKSNAVYTILERLMKTTNQKTKKPIKFLVVEPAKGEYKHKFGHYDNVSVFGTNSKVSRLLRINPFSFPREVHVREHIDKLIGIFNVCWEMSAAMPAVLKDAVERAYLTAGWDLHSSENRYVGLFGEPVFPCFKDVLQEIRSVMDSSDYSEESKGDYKGALVTRVRSLTNGLYADVFTPDELSGQELFDENVIVDLSRNSGSETASLIMGILIMKMQEYRMSSHIPSNSGLRHVTVLEEAHNLLKKAASGQNAGGAGLAGKSVEMISNSIAEMRTYGEGFIIADQAPGLLDPAAIRNTNTKIILRLPDEADRELVGKAAALNKEQIGELARLKRGAAAIYQNEWIQPILCQVDRCTDDEQEYVYEAAEAEKGSLHSLINELLLFISTGRIALTDEMRETLRRCNMPAAAKIQLAALFDTEAPDQALISSLLFELLDPGSAFKTAGIFQNSPAQWVSELSAQIPELRKLGRQCRYVCLVYLIYAAYSKGLLDEAAANQLTDHCLTKRSE